LSIDIVGEMEERIREDEGFLSNLKILRLNCDESFTGNVKFGGLWKSKCCRVSLFLFRHHPVLHE
jgi:hypothetical protein